MLSGLVTCMLAIVLSKMLETSVDRLKLCEVEKYSVNDGHDHATLCFEGAGSSRDCGGLCGVTLELLGTVDYVRRLYTFP